LKKMSQQKMKVVGLFIFIFEFPNI
jgi:hypothetical protein